MRRIFPRFPRPKLTERSFAALVKKHGLEGRIDFHMSSYDGNTLVPIISEDGKAPQIPGDFIKEFVFLFFEGKDPWERRWPFKIGEPRTLESIRKEIDSWNGHCDLAWQADG